MTGWTTYLRRIFGSKTPGQLHGSVFDIGVILLSLILGFIFPSISDFIHSPSASIIMLLAFVFYITGAWLKHLPLGRRLAINKNRLDPGNWVGLLLLFHFCVMLIIGTIVAGDIGTFTGWFTKQNGSVSGAYILVSVMLAIISTAIVAYAGSPHGSRKQYPEKGLVRREWAGDIFLIIATSVFTFVFWDKGMEPAIQGGVASSFGILVPRIFIIAFLFLLLYLPFRYLYLKEDVSSRSTWNRLLLLLLIVVIRSVFSML